MAVQQDPLQISPYTSTVPLVQVSPEAMAGSGVQPSPPLQGQFGKKGTGALALGDALVKGILQGHQAKAQQKYATAQTTIAAADAASEAAFQKYQDALTAANGKTDDPAAKAAYEAYQSVFNQGKEAKAKFVIPEKPKKGQKTGGDTDPVKSPDDKKKKQVPGMGGIKEFFEANPHIVPQIALLTMQPKPQGLTPQNKVQNLELQRAQKEEQQADVTLQREQQKQADLTRVSQSANLTPEQIAALPPDEQKELAAARFRLNSEQPARAKYDQYVDEGGNYHSIMEGQEVPPGWKPFVKPTASSIPKIGTESEFTAQAYKKYGVTADNADPGLSKYIHDWWQWKKAQTTQNTSTSTQDVSGVRTTKNASTRGTPEPKPPAGFAPVEESQQSGGITPPPQAAAPTATPTPGKIAKPPASPKSGPGKIAAPPKAGEPTLTDANRTGKVETEKHTAYQKAEDKYQKALAEIKKAYQKAGVDTPESKAALQQQNDAALAELNKDKQGIESWYAEQVHLIGGRMPNDLPDQARSQLKRGYVTTFGNGQQWTIDANGQPKQIK